jgi:hypothetical protein
VPLLVVDEDVLHVLVRVAAAVVDVGVSAAPGVAVGVDEFTDRHAGQPLRLAPAQPERAEHAAGQHQQGHHLAAADAGQQAQGQELAGPRVPEQGPTRRSAMRNPRSAVSRSSAMRSTGAGGSAVAAADSAVARRSPSAARTAAT